MLLERLVTELERNRNHENAYHMERYMKKRFPFLGIKTPERRNISNQFFKQTGITKEPFNVNLVQALWERREREYQNIALDYIEKMLPKVGKEQLELLEKLITTKSWWDTVDMLAQKPIGKIAMESPEVIPERIAQWAHHENMWLRRTAILFQLKYKDRTNEELLYTYIKINASSTEFFIQKAIGWALREYSKTNPASVRMFIQENDLAKLSIREGSKYI
ncbi:DNA alkylation repair protein [Ornithinibacillus sp. BX22]|uniref:DNA alkylation repair protein n=2 Tax=Ornithinibacillus TaxID=484508 RepID=A0A923L423_9BACI|nr:MULTISPECIES: DNA alkylation repair protein [Ornithinibacillus]MBC5636089.1 DNA alkylation repair protein [Ornithinibacillus hominis]MBS3679903.1 DNA alkylation repair protein [Ornithinibacillus massiliensis]